MYTELAPIQQKYSLYMSMKETCLNAFHNLPCKYILINTTCNTCIFHMVVNSSSESFVPRNSTSTLMRSQYCDWWRLPSGTKGTNLKFFKNPSNWHDLCQKGLRVKCSYRKNSDLYSYCTSPLDVTVHVVYYRVVFISTLHPFQGHHLLHGYLD